MQLNNISQYLQTVNFYLITLEDFFEIFYVKTDYQFQYAPHLIFSNQIKINLFSNNHGTVIE